MENSPPEAVPPAASSAPDAAPEDPKLDSRESPASEEAAPEVPNTGIYGMLKGMPHEDLLKDLERRKKNPHNVNWPWSVLRLLDGEASEPLVDGLICAGDQVLLASPPKTGKSFLALELALRLAVGAGSFLTPKWRIKSPRRVLYISLEMPAGPVAARLPAHEKLCAADPAAYGHNLFFIFPSLDDRDGKGTWLRHESIIKYAIKCVMPEFIIIDTLIQIHREDENDNIAMGAVMRAVRRLCRLPPEESTRDRENGDRVAHLVLHHNRKSLPGERNYERGISSARGAGSIHSEVDLALVLETSTRDPNKATLGVSARYLDTPPFLKLERRKEPAFHYVEEAEKDPSAAALESGVLARAHIAAREAFARSMALAGLTWSDRQYAKGRDVEILIGHLMFEALASEPPMRPPAEVWKQLREKDAAITYRQVSKGWGRLQELGIILKIKGSRMCVANAKAKDSWLEKLWPQTTSRVARAKSARVARR